ncbi:MAG: LamG domain-containing protein [Bacteroidetes bacterium]|nr:LamG domain-containing protein [Bacteroidota bacterium]
MNLRTVIVVCFLMSAIACKKSSKSISDINLTKGLLAYYPFNGNANDESGNQLNGTIQNGVSFTGDISGKANSAVTFDGSTGYIIVNDPKGILQTDSVSFSFLVKASDVASRGAILNKVNPNDATGLSFAMDISSPTSNHRFNFGAVPNTFDCSSTNYDNNGVSINNGADINADTWYHVVAIFSNSVQSIYVNGVLKTSITKSYAALNRCPTNTYLLIGGWWKNDIISFHGILDEIRIYNRALNFEEITELAKPVLN